MTRLRRIVLLCLAAPALTCDGGPRAGDVVLDLTTDSEDLGGVVFRMTAAEPNTIDTVVAACAGCQLYMVRQNEREIRGVLAGDLSSGPAIRATVTDARSRASYVGVIVEAAGDDYQLRSVTELRLAVPAQ